MSFLMRSLSRERARTGDLREGRAEVLRELVVGGPGGGAAINWPAVSQLLGLVQAKGAIPEVVRKILKDLLSSDDLPTGLQTLAIVDMLALNCPTGRVRSQLAGPKWAKRLGARVAATSVRGCPPGLPAALAQLLANWAVTFEGSELGGAAAHECARLAARGYMLPPPSDEAYAAAATVAAQAAGAGDSGSILPGADFARDFLPPRPLLRTVAGEEGGGGEGQEREGTTGAGVGGGSAPLSPGQQPAEQPRPGPLPHAPLAVLTQAGKAASPAFEPGKGHPASLGRRSAEPAGASLMSAPQGEVSEPQQATGGEGVARPQAGGAAQEQLASAVAETVACVKRDKTVPTPLPTKRAAPPELPPRCVCASPW